MPLLEVAFRPSLTYLLDAEDRYRTVAVGGLLLLFAVFVVPLFLVAGYHVRVLRRSMAGDESPPAFEWWRDLAADGLRAWIVVSVYLLGLVVVSVGHLFAIGLVGFILRGPDPTLSFAHPAVLTGLGSNVLVALLIGYVLPAAIAATAERTAVSAGLALRDLWPVVTSRAYLRAWLAADAVLVGTVAVSGVGTLLAPFLLFYGTTAAWHLFGRGLRNVRDLRDSPGVSGARHPDRRPPRPGDHREHASNALVGAADAVRSLAPTGAWGAVESNAATAGRATTGEGADVERDLPVDAATVGALADRPPETLDAADVDTLVAALDADDPETVATAARTLGEVAGARPDLIADSGATPPLRDLRLADDPRVGEAATRAIRRFSEAGLY